MINKFNILMNEKNEQKNINHINFKPNNRIYSYNNYNLSCK